jgi:hypothetical protein
MLLIKLGLVSPSILQEPQYVMTPALAAEISDRVAAFNQIIKTDASHAGIALADIEAGFQQLQKTPPKIQGVSLLLRYKEAFSVSTAFTPPISGCARGRRFHSSPQLHARPEYSSTQ